MSGCYRFRPAFSGRGCYRFRPAFTRAITRYDVVGGYLNLDGLIAVAESPEEES